MRQRLLAFLLALANFLLAVGASVGLQLLVRGHVPNLVGLSLGTALLVLLYLAGCRWIERRRTVELQLDNSVRQVWTGFALGGTLFCSVMAILAACGAYTPSGLASFRSLGPGLLFAAVAAVFEEVVFRGFLFRLFANLAGNWAGLAVTACLFGLAHKGNPHATLTSSAAIAIEAGILLGAAYAASGSLWLPIGIHAGWNFTEGSVFGMAVSGNNLPAGVITGNLHGPAILTGGTFGPEASIVAVTVCLIAAGRYLIKMKHLPPSSVNNILPADFTPSGAAQSVAEPER